MVGCELVGASPLEVRVVALVGGRMAIVSGDDAEVVEPPKYFRAVLGSQSAVSAIALAVVGSRVYRMVP